MTRPKVPPDQRQRTAQACESCKRRKQKCNGQQPCNTCDKRKFACIYAERDPTSPEDVESNPVAKKQNTGQPSPSRSNTTTGQSPDQPPTFAPGAPHISQAPAYTAPRARTGFERDLQDGGAQLLENNPRAKESFPTDMSNVRNMSRATTQSAPDEEAVVYPQIRMLQDPTGRLLYVGDSATLAFLQLLRMMVENVTGPQLFTTDPQRHRIQETQLSVHTSKYQAHLLPDQRTARALVQAYFTNTHSILQIFNVKLFYASLESCYSDPLTASPSWLCLLNLVFAIGLTLATPRPGSPEFGIIQKLRSETPDRGELFFLNAKNFSDPVVGLEDADFWSVQALLLISYYMLTKAKRNASFAYLGMAVRSAYALGLHREETLRIFGPEEQTSRRNTWRSLFILDRFISCHLGRPTAISEEECSGDSLRPRKSLLNGKPIPPATDFDSVAVAAQEAAERKISTGLATEIAEVCREWPSALSPTLQWRQAPNASPETGIAILHVNLFYCHSIILLTRPFFLFVLNRETQKMAGTMQEMPSVPRRYTRMEKFSESCVIASTHTVVLIRNAYEAGYLPQRDPFVVYFLLAASLVVLANEFAELYTHKAADECIQNAITLMDYCGKVDPHAERLMFILTTFWDLVVQQRERRARKAIHQPVAPTVPPVSTQMPSPPRPTSGPPDSRQQSPKTVSFSANTLHPLTIDSSMGKAGLPTFDAPSGNPQWGSQFEFNKPPLPHSIQASNTQRSSDPSTSQFAPPPLSPSVTFSPSSATSTSAFPPPALTPISAGLPGPLDTHTSLASFLDISALDNSHMGFLRDGADGSNGSDAEGDPDCGLDIDFDSLWALAGGTGMPGTMVGANDVQGVSDSMVPLFGVVD